MLHHGKLDEMAIRAAAMILLCSVLLVFFMPAAVGPFSAVYGPATALRANRAARAFYFNLALSALNPITALTTGLYVAPWPGASSPSFVESDASAPHPALRC